MAVLVTAVIEEEAFVAVFKGSAALKEWYGNVYNIFQMLHVSMLFFSLFINSCLYTYVCIHVHTHMFCPNVNTAVFCRTGTLQLEMVVTIFVALVLYVRHVAATPPTQTT